MTARTHTRLTFLFAAIAAPAMLAAGATFTAWQAKAKPSGAHPQTVGAKKAASTARQAAQPTTPGAAIPFTGNWEKSWNLPEGKVIEISARVLQPSSLPNNGRISVEWTLAGDEGKRIPSVDKETPKPDPKKPVVVEPRKPDAFGIYTLPTANWRKVVNALDPDVYMVYRVPKAGKYTLRMTAVTNEGYPGMTPRWREKGNAPGLYPIPEVTPWPAGTKVNVAATVTPVALGNEAEQARLKTAVELEPNDTPEMAQPLTIASDEPQMWEITGTSDDVDYFDEPYVGRAGDDWFKVTYKGATPRILGAQLGLPGQMIAARIRTYHELKPAQSGQLAAIEEYSEGLDPNERVHQQDEQHRTNISRLMKPGETYYVRVEANSPGYQLQLRVSKPGPYDDPREAVRQAMFTHVGQVDAWLSNRPRGASVERRIRDTGNLLGTQCMSCHTQSGVWGPAVPIQNGYRVANVQNYWHMQNVMYECLRPTNELKDAANNTSLAPLDIGDGPAGTRAAGFNLVNLERIQKPHKLHAKQQVRTANFVLLTADPGGINAAGPGSNIGVVIVQLMATEILKTAWESTGEPKYFQGMEAKARNAYRVKPVYTDDVALRLEYFNRVLPLDKFLEWGRKSAETEKAAGAVKTDVAKLETFVADVRKQLTEDEARLRGIQNEDGTWGFSPGKWDEGTKSWKATDKSFDPSPTAVAITGLTAAGATKDDPTVAKGVKALLRIQEPQGRWNKEAQTGFISTSYALHALSRLYPVEPPVYKPQDYKAKPKETLLESINRVRTVALLGDARFESLLLDAASHASPLVRYWAMIGLGGTHTEKSVPALVAATNDATKPVRDAATWALRSAMLDDHGLAETLTAFNKGGDVQRAQIMQALNIRADYVMTKAKVNWSAMNTLFDRAMNTDKAPAVRAWASKAAWQFWVWNPPARSGINTAWIKMLQREEPVALVENCNRYSSQALFIANGHKSNGSKEHQYKELGELFSKLTDLLDSDALPAVTKNRLARRLVGVGGTFFSTSGGDGGPGQMGYITEGAGDMMGKAAMIYLADTTKGGDLNAIRAGLEGGANVPNKDLTKFLVDYSLKGPEELRALAAGSVSDPRSVMLAAVPELVEPQLAQIMRGALEPPRRAQVSDPILDLWATVNWVVPQTAEQQRNFFNLIIPKLDKYVSKADIEKMADAAKRVETEREMSAQWYLADRLGEVLEKNPDLHTEIVFRDYFPSKLSNPLQERYWLRSVEWLLTFAPKAEPVEVKKSASAKSGFQTVAFQKGQDKEKDKADISLTIKDRALQLYLDQLRPTADPKSREIAIQMANKTAFRRNPEVLRALAECLKFEKNEDLRNIIQNVLRQGSEKFMPDLTEYLKKEKHASIQFEGAEPKLTKPQLDDIVYFRDYVLPELSRQKRLDQQSCIGCHGLPGRVPSLTLAAPDKFGYYTVDQMMNNYRLLQQRVNLADIDRSKILRKPLNIQDGKEDGHQGGRRYSPDDEGYQTLRTWALAQPAVQKAAAPSANAVTTSNLPIDQLSRILTEYQPISQRHSSPLSERERARVKENPTRR